MNTTTTYQALQAGQAFAWPARQPKSLVLVEGEVLVQAPAQWLGDALVLSQPMRVTAPQTLNIGEGCGVIASTRSKVAIEEARRGGGWLAGAFLRPQTA